MHCTQHFYLLTLHYALCQAFAHTPVPAACEEYFLSVFFREGNFEKQVTHKEHLHGLADYPIISTNAICCSCFLPPLVLSPLVKDTPLYPKGPLS